MIIHYPYRDYKDIDIELGIANVINICSKSINCFAPEGVYIEKLYIRRNYYILEIRYM